ncbi:hypothetical protein [Streptomyces mangrovisoli]|uniref:Serine/arginine repetitive matrix protein 2 n=1 Tax=Streptomyces mangrovisoli TaxID=1428628 RepID=A0A1J4NXZ3_9ACTN|nr:hypothetical protein [Streptomyces mangrovisoli]OIJ67401.1 hypothetical protein WN71_012465 [Streptomyces mangrovisoli]
MSGRYEYDDAGSGPEREPSEERGRAAWSGGETGAVPPWASAQTQAGGAAPPPWASAQTRSGGGPPPSWTSPPPPASGPLPPPPGTAHATPPGTPYPTPPYTLAPGVPPARPARRTGRLVAAVVLTVVVGAGAGAGGWYLTRDHSTGSEAGAGTTVSAPPQSSAPGSTPPASPSATDASDAGTGPASTPASGPATASAAPGYRTADDPIGYRVQIPEGWTRREKQGEKAPVVTYESPGDGRQLQIFRVTEPTPAASLELAETAPGYGFAHQRGYQVLDRASGDGWSELTYRYDDKDEGARRVVDHRFEASDGTLYAIRASGPESLGADLVGEPLTTAVASFCPSGAQCG